MNKYFIETINLPDEYLFMTNLPEMGEKGFLNTYKRELQKFNIKKSDLIMRESFIHHKHILDFQEKFLKQKEYSEKCLLAFKRATYLHYFIGDSSIKETLTFYNLMMREENKNFLKKLIISNFHDIGCNYCLNDLIADNCFFSTIYTLNSGYVADTLIFVPYRIKGLLPFLYFKNKQKLYKDTLNVCLNLIRTFPEQTFSLIASLYHFCRDYDRENFENVINFIKENKNVYDFLESIKMKNLLDVKIYGSNFAPYNHLTNQKIDDYFMGYSYFE